MKTTPTVWLADLTYTQQVITSDVMPAAIGSIATFSEAQLNLPRRIRLFKYPERLAAALENEIPDVIGFSNYVWNLRLSYKFAQAIKKLNPKTVVVFGGPNYPTVPREQEEFLRRHPLMDFYIIKEGEEGFAGLLSRLMGCDLDAAIVKSGPSLHSAHCLKLDGTANLPPEAERLKDLTVIPSPYTTGHLDEFFDGKLIPILQTNRGCPFLCTFCVEGGTYYNKVHRNSGEKISEEIDYIGRKMAERRDKGGRNDLYISDSNFGMYKQDLETCKALAQSMERYGWPEYINTTTGKNAKERVLEAARLVKGALRLSGSVQSLDQVVLKNIKRDNISEEQILALAMESSEIGANSYSEIILGLPGDSKQAHYRSIRTIVSAGFNSVLTWQLMVLPGSELCAAETRRKYGMVTKYRILPRCYGTFSVRGEPVVASEIEEVCVANSTLPFEDYLICRRLHLVIAIFYNDTVFSGLLRFLKLLDIESFKWLEMIASYPVTGRLSEVFESFERETRAELYDNFEDLADIADREENVRRYINGEAGNNVLYLHRAMALTQYTQELADFAGETVRALLREEGHLTPARENFIQDVLVYMTHRLKNIFSDRQVPVRAALQYDVPAFEQAAAPRSIDAYVHRLPKQYSFVLSPDQEETLSRYQNIYGNSLVQTARILMKLYVGKLFRRAVLDENQQELARAAREEHVISGLQDSLS